MNDRLVWIDCEMTGLDIRADALIEVAALVTDFDLNVLGGGIDIIVKPSQESLDQMIDFVRSMHEKSGLLDELDAGTTLADAEDQAQPDHDLDDGQQVADRRDDRLREEVVGPHGTHAVGGVGQLEGAGHDPHAAGQHARDEAEPVLHIPKVRR